MKLMWSKPIVICLSTEYMSSIVNAAACSAKVCLPQNLKMIY